MGISSDFGQISGLGRSIRNSADTNTGGATVASPARRAELDLRSTWWWNGLGGDRDLLKPKAAPSAAPEPSTSQEAAR
jgi:hypothetical protein